MIKFLIYAILSLAVVCTIAVMIVGGVGILIAFPCLLGIVVGGIIYRRNPSSNDPVGRSVMSGLLAAILDIILLGLWIFIPRGDGGHSDAGPAVFYYSSIVTAPISGILGAIFGTGLGQR